MVPNPRLVSIINQLPRNPGPSINIALGELIPLSENELRAQWVGLTKDTSLERARLVIHLIPAEQQCMVCFEKYHPANKETTCPHCGSVGAKILAGEEFYLETTAADDE